MIVRKGFNINIKYNKGNQYDNDKNVDSLLYDDTREAQVVVNSSDDDVNLGNMQYRNYLEKHKYKLDADGVYKLGVGDVLFR